MNPILAFQNWYLNASPDKKKKALLIGIGSLATLALLVTTAGGDSSTDVNEPAALFYLGVAVKLAAVLLLIAGGGLILRRWYGNRAMRSDRQMHLVETIRLSPRQALHVVEVNGQHFLIGATDQAISMLSSVDLTPLETESISAPSPTELPGSEHSFGELFHAVTHKSPPAQPTDQPSNGLLKP